MPEDYLHVSGPIYVTGDEDDEAEFDPEHHTLSDEWYRGFCDALDVLSGRLPQIMQGWQEHWFDIRVQLGDDWIPGIFFFHVVELPSFARESVRRFVDAVTAAAMAKGGPIWATSETTLGQHAAAHLGRTDVGDVARLIRYMESCDLDHEVDHGAQISAPVASLGWTPETVACWVARHGTCCGQHGHEAEWTPPNGDTLEQWIGDNEDRHALVVRLIAGNMLAMLSREDADRGDDFYRGQIDDDLVDVFFNPEYLAGNGGLGGMAEAIAEEAAAAAKTEVSKHLAANTWPDHWLGRLAD